LKENGP